VVWITGISLTVIPSKCNLVSKHKWIALLLASMSCLRMESSNPQMAPPAIGGGKRARWMVTGMVTILLGLGAWYLGFIPGGSPESTSPASIEGLIDCEDDTECLDIILSGCLPGKGVGYDDNQAISIVIDGMIDTQFCGINASISLESLAPVVSAADDLNADGRLDMNCLIPTGHTFASLTTYMEKEAAASCDGEYRDFVLRVMAEIQALDFGE
jgi:hypothetical protein